MAALIGKVAVVTGSSSGIGRATNDWPMMGPLLW